MKRLLICAALLAPAPLLMAQAVKRNYVNTNDPTAQQIAAADDPARAYADVVNVAVTVDLKDLHPAVDLARLDCWTAAGLGGSGPGTLRQTVADFQGDKKDPGYGSAAARMHQLAAQAPYYRTTFSQQFPITARAYHGVQSASFAVVPIQLTDPVSKTYYEPPAFLTHCMVFLHAQRSGEWRQALPVLTQIEPATVSNFAFVAQSSRVEAYIVSEPPGSRYIASDPSKGPQPTPK
ncbi:MAG TPA: hypothetical protein VET46_13395 [Steroidobacteraceae bacterium]|nr:hypothetical protein [Steroidobacteraceae bacterium]